MFSFEVLAADSGSVARRGRIVTPHGAFDTPAFMPVGTRGSVKGVTPEQLRETGTQIILGNTYHLMLRPGPEIVAQLGGLQKFTGWNGPMLTDSGGYQVFSLAEINRVNDEGVIFRSHIDGSLVHLDPARVMEVQNAIGADIIMVLDECPPLPSERDRIANAVERSILWAAQCKAAHRGHDQWLFGIVQGGLDLELRQTCARRLINIGFDGYAIGGLSVGETHPQMVETLAATVPQLPADKPRYLMGVGMPRDLFQAVTLGVDMFDCVLPTRNGRNGYVFTADGPLRMRNQVHQASDLPLEPGCPCYTCRQFSRGYIRHLFLADEMLGPTLVSIHNLRFFQRLMARMRELIPEGKLGTILDEYPVAGAAPEPEWS